MYIVYIDYEKYSIWDTLEEAQHQVEILKNHGHGRDTRFRIDSLDTDKYESGHYFF